MQNPNQSSAPTSTFRTILLIILITLVVAVIPARAQNAVPPTARQAATMPAFAHQLKPPAAPQSPRKFAVSTRARIRPGSPLDNTVAYDNGPVNGEVDAWTINFGFTVSDTIQVNGPVTGIQFWAWLEPGDTITNVEAQIGSTGYFSNNLFDGTVTLTQSSCFTNDFGFDVCLVSGNFTGPNLSGNDWITLANAATSEGNPVYWDENSGVGCLSPGCPSMAQENTLGTLPSEAFTLTGAATTTTGPPCFSEQPQNGFQVIHDFTGNGDGAQPVGLVSDKAGNLYGTDKGGDDNAGMAFKLASEGSGWVFDPLYSFTGGYNGYSPSPLMLGPEGALYGAALGGISNCNDDDGCGLIFKLTPQPTACHTALCSWAENVLYRFTLTGVSDVWGGGVAAFDQAGNIYGIGFPGAYGQGAVFELTPSTGGWTEKVLFSFPGGVDGTDPSSLLMGKDGNLYGTTWLGGAYGYGVIFQLVHSASGWTENVLGSFGVPPGPYGKPPMLLAQDNDGNLFGVYYYQFDVREGTETDAIGFMVSLNGSISEVFYLTPEGDYNDYVGVGGLGIDPTGDLYGTASAWCFDCGWGGWPIYGEVFNVLHEGNNWQFGIEVSFQGQNFPVSGNLTLDSQGNVYGTTWGCGKYGRGSAWQLSP